MKIVLTAADSISYPDHPHEFFSVPNQRIGTELREGEGYILGSQFVSGDSILSGGHQACFDKEPPTAPSTKALTYDNGKPPLAELPWKALREVAMVIAYGASKKYEPYNWKKGMESTRTASCAIRHAADYLDGHDIDPESGRHALAHSACRLLFLLENIIEGTVVDNRYQHPKPSPAKQTT